VYVNAVAVAANLHANVSVLSAMIAENLEDFAYVVVMNAKT
jgi:hypothetical protein